MVNDFLTHFPGLELLVVGLAMVFVVSMLTSIVCATVATIAHPCGFYEKLYTRRSLAASKVAMFPMWFVPALTDFYLSH